LDKRNSIKRAALKGDQHRYPAECEERKSISGNPPLDLGILCIGGASAAIISLLIERLMTLRSRFNGPRRPVFLRDSATIALLIPIAVNYKSNALVLS